MAIQKSTLINTKDGKIEYIYPKTSADVVQYDETKSLEDKINDILDEIEELKKIKPLSGIESLYNTILFNISIYDCDDNNIEKILIYNNIENYTTFSVSAEEVNS